MASYVPEGLPKAKLGAADAVVPPAAAPELAVPAPPNSEGFAVPPAPPAGPNEKGVEAGCDAPAVVGVLPKSGLLGAGVVVAPPNSEFPPAAPAPPKREGAAAGVLVPEDVLLLAAPNRFEVPELAAAPNRGLFGVLVLLLLPKLKAMVLESTASPGTR